MSNVQKLLELYKVSTQIIIVHNTFASQVPQDVTVFLIVSQHFVLVHLPLLHSLLGFPKMFDILQLGLLGLFDLGLLLSSVVDHVQFPLLRHSVSLHSSLALSGLHS